MDFDARDYDSRDDERSGPHGDRGAEAVLKTIAIGTIGGNSTSGRAIATTTGATSDAVRVRIRARRTLTLG